MATYKVIQDVEAEDKLVGPLTLRQFIYAGITAVCGYICFVLITKHIYFLIPVFFLPGALTGFFAFPFGRDQPTEIWALAKIRFLIKPRRRIWDQSGVKQLVTITAPRRIEVHYTDGLSQTEVKSRLKALADTIDTRGWAVKNVTGGIYTQSTTRGMADTDRLVQVDTLPQAAAVADEGGAHDMLAEQDNPVASTFDRMIQQSDQVRRNQAIESMRVQAPSPAQPYVADMSGPQLPQPQTRAFAPSQPTPPVVTPPANASNDYWFMSQPPAVTNTPTRIVRPSSPVAITATPALETEAEKNLAEQLREQNNSQGISYAHLHTILPLAEQQALAQKAQQAAAVAKAAQTPVTHPPDPAIIALASNNDLNVATIAREANKQTQESPDEVVVSLH